MTTDEIRALVAQKIAGQGSAIDVGGALPTILNGILDGIGSLKTFIDESIKKIEDAAAYERACQQYLTIEATEDSTALSWHFPSNFDTSLAKTIQYSTDNGLTWNNVAADVKNYGNIGTINAGQKVLLRGNGATGFYDADYDDYAGNFLYADKPCYVYGNAMSLLFGANFINETSVPEYALACLFFDYNESVSGEWVLSKEGSSLVLPATTLADYCYQNMFNGCTSLATAPKLPATTLASNCYNGMFYGCTSLTAVPELPATTLADYCYQNMFSGCTSLTAVPELPATTLADYCYQNMFHGCTSLTAVPELPATTLASNCYNGMFSGCTSLATAPELPATTLASNCYQDMFSGCTSLTAVPELPATTLASNCYSGMFFGCTSLTAVPELPATTLASNCYNGMFSGCTSLVSVKCLASAVSPSNAVTNWLNNVSATGTFTKAAGVEWPSGASGIPSGWEVVEV